VDALSKKGRSSEAIEIQHKFPSFFRPGKNPDVGLMVSSQNMGKKQDALPWGYWMAGGVVLAAAVGTLLTGYFAGRGLVRRPQLAVPIVLHRRRS